MKLADIVRSCKPYKISHVSWFNDFIDRFSQATKPPAQKLADFIDRLTSALVNKCCKITAFVY